MFQARPIARAARLCALSSLLALSGQANAAIHALLIGITDYKAAGISDLQGPANDIQLMNDVLVDRFKVPTANIKLLRNGTHTQIRSAFADLTAKVQKGDQVYIHYSGHGSWYKSPLASERRGQDETWVTHGARAPGSQGDDAYDVLDKEVGTWLMALHKVTDNVVLVSDSCHSGSMTRDVQVGARASDGVAEVHPLRSKLPDVIDLDENKGVRIGAAREFESAVELDPVTNARCYDPKRCYGVLTWNWAQALRSSRPGESWGDVYNRALAAIEATPQVVQRPQKEGNVEVAVFDGKFAPLTHTVPVRSVEKDGTVQLGAGRLAGLTEGSELVSVVPEGQTPARLEVTSVAAATAQAKPLAGTVTAGAQLKVAKYKEVESRITLYVGGPQAKGVDAAMAARVRQAIEQARGVTLQGFDLVDKPEAAQWQLALVRPVTPTADPKAGSLPGHVTCQAQPCAGTELWVLNANGQLMHPKMSFSMAEPDKELPRLLSNLASFAKAQEVRGIARQGNATPLEALVTVLRPPAGSKETCKQGATSTTGWQRLPAKPLASLSSKDVQFNDCLAFTIKNKDGKPWYGYVLSVNPKFAIDRIWPGVNMTDDQARIEANGSFEVKTSWYRLNNPGADTLLFVASEQQTPMSGLTDAGMRNTGAPQSALKRLMRAGALTRDVESDVKEGPWGAQSVTLDVAAAR